MYEVPRIFSFGGGVQSTAALVLASQGHIAYKTFLFANVGEDSENPDTLQYVHEYAIPFAHAHGLEIVEVQRPGATLYQHITRPGNTYASIPMRLSNGKPGRRACTHDYKVAVIDRWLLLEAGVKHQLVQEQNSIRAILKTMRRQGTVITPDVRTQVKERFWQSSATRPLAVVGLGISLDEIHRARTYSPLSWKALDYPLIQLRLARDACIEIIRRADLPIPPQSACTFCPFKTLARWRELRLLHPDRFEQAAKLEENFNKGRRSPMWLTHTGMPLRQAVDDEYTQETLWGDLCESGHCWT